MSQKISEDVLRGIGEALQAHAPHLLPNLYKIMRGGEPQPPSMRQGASIYAKLSGAAPWQDAEPILLALQAVENELGYNAIFAGRQINWLVVCWREFSEPRKLEPNANAKEIGQ